MTSYLNPLDVLTEGRTLPAGYDRWAIEATRPDGATRRSYVWPDPGHVAEAPGPIDADNSDSYPSKVGDGICVGYTWRGMGSGYIPAITLLLVAVKDSDVLGDSPHTARVRSALVVDRVDGERFLRERGARLDLTGAYLPRAYLTGAYLPDANMARANMPRAYMPDANLTGAYLPGANLIGAFAPSVCMAGADVRGADLNDAYMPDADVRGADFMYANVTGADFRYADVAGANFTGAWTTRDTFDRSPLAAHGWTLNDRGRIERAA